MSRLPVHLTSFVGREREVAGVEALLARQRLVTLTGSGGCGKTRLAIAVAGRTAGEVRFCGLASTTGDEEVAGAVARAVEATGSITAAIGGSSMLLVLDNCEHVVRAAAPLAGELLAACPQLRILATSREALSIPGEVTVRVPSLSPEEAQALFADRSRDVRDDFVATDDVATICERLDGIPLAIELAAARGSSLTPRQIAAGLDDSLHLLNRGPRTAVPRHQTLRASIDWSYHLLRPDEQVALRRLAAFAGGFGLEAAEAVVGFAPLAEDQVLDLLSALVEQSLVVVDATGTEARYRLLETIRQYAGEQLAVAPGDEASLVAVRHRAHHRRLLALAEAAAEGPEQDAWQERIDLELDNLRAALHSAQRAGATAELAELVGAMGNAWSLRGLYEEQRRWLSTALELVPDDDPERADLLYLLGNALMYGDALRAGEVLADAVTRYDRAGDAVGAFWADVEYAGSMTLVHGADAGERAYERAHHRAAELDDVVAARYAQFHEANLLMWAGRLQTARSRLEAFLALPPTPVEHHVRWAVAAHGSALSLQGHHRDAIDRLEELLARTPPRDALTRVSAAGSLGWSLALAGDTPRAAGVLQEAEPEARVLGLVFHVLAGIGLVALLQGDAARARDHLQEAVDRELVSRPLGFGWGSSVLVDALVALGDLDRAAELVERALVDSTAVGADAFTALLLSRAAEVAWRRGDEATARRHLRRALPIHRVEGNVTGLIDGLELAATLPGTARERPSVPAALWATADAERRRVGYLARLPGRPTPPEAAAGDTTVASLELDDAIRLVTGHEAGHRPTTGVEALTDAERRVAELAAQGLTNPQIAERLFLSRHTVDSHLRRVFAKVGVNSRVALAASMAGRNGVDA